MRFPITPFSSLSRWVKIPLIIAGSLLLLLVAGWIVLALYIQSNKKHLLESITSQLNENINGKVAVEDMSLALHGFPGISVGLENVTLRDSLWQTHRHDLLHAKHIYVSVNVLSLLKKKPKVRDVNIADASVYIYIDSSGYTNASVFAKKDNKPKEKKKKQPEISHISFTDVELALDNRTKKKMFRLDFRTLVAAATYNDTGWVAQTREDVVFKDFTFNEEKGSFVKNKRLRARLTLHFDNKLKALFIPAQSIKLDDDELTFWAKFMFNTSPPQFSLKFTARQILYKNAVALTSPNIQQKLNLMDVKDPVDLYTFIDGRIKFRDTPIVRVNWVVKNNVFITPGGEITNCSFTGSYLNSKTPGWGTNDKNSLISVPVFVGNYSGIPFKADSLLIENLIQPVLTGNLQSSFKLDKLNDAIGSEALNISKGNAMMDLVFRVGLSKDDPSPPFLKGYVSIRDLGFTYLPRNISFNNSDVTLFFTGHDLLVRKTKLQSKSSVLFVEGSILNFLNLYYTAPEKILLDWNITSPLINLNEFQSLLSARAKAKAPPTVKASRGAGRVASQLDVVLDKSNANMKLNISKVVYKKFTAKNITAMMLLDQTGITIRNARVHNSDGLLNLNAIIDQRGKINDVALKATVDNVNVKKFFAEFSNFGQTALRSENLNGSLSADINAKTQITDDGQVVGGSMFGAVHFMLKNGELTKFEPFEKIGKFLFRNRNLEHVTFRDIQGRFDLQGNSIKINPLRVESSAFTMAVEGVYGLKGGTSIFIDLPLRNPKKDADILDDSLRAIRSMKGIVLRLQAVDGSDGKVQIKLRTGTRKKAEYLRKEEEKAENK
ncbi:MAG TPA: AsmA-like C-terminal region-containing protein [Flavipsychrobacter sp.]|nr:AsmA-like C-terminal region-containing protein [Flavipsychrobacter sp.]